MARNPHPMIGPITDPAYVAGLVQDHLRAWSETYLSALGHEYHGNPDHYPKVRSWGTVPNTSPEDVDVRSHVAPAIMVTPTVIQSTQGGVETELGAMIVIEVIVYTIAASDQAARELASIYGTSVWATVTHHPYLPDLPGGHIIFSAQEIADRPRGTKTEGWSMISLIVQTTHLTKGSEITEPIQGRALPDPATLDLINDVTTEWITA